MEIKIDVTTAAAAALEESSRSATREIVITLMKRIEIGENIEY